MKGIDEVSSLDIFEKVNFIFRLLIFLLIFKNSADFDGCRKLTNRKKENITFLVIPEFNLNFNFDINPADFQDLFCLEFLLDHLLKIQIEIFQQRKRR